MRLYRVSLLGGFACVVDIEIIWFSVSLLGEMIFWNVFARRFVGVFNLRTCLFCTKMCNVGWSFLWSVCFNVKWLCHIQIHIDIKSYRVLVGGRWTWPSFWGESDLHDSNPRHKAAADIYIFIYVYVFCERPWTAFQKNRQFDFNLFPKPKLFHEVVCSNTTSILVVFEKLTSRNHLSSGK